MTHAFVSVVTPVHNGAQFIRECIESVLAQTYEHWEYVIVDNCSTDGTLEIARSYAAEDARIRVLAPEDFVGQMESADRSLREISPESTYTKILHADDWLFPECLEQMVQLAEKHPTVGIVSAYRLEETRVTLVGLPHSISTLRGREIGRSTLLGSPYPYLLGSPSSLLIRSDIVRARDPFYDPTYSFTPDYPLSEDQDACCAIFRDADFGFVHQVLTFTRRDDRSPFAAYVRLGASVPERLNLLVRYGPEFLTQSDYQRKLAVLGVRYWLFLLRSFPRVADSEFRDYHRSALQRLVRTIQPRDVKEGALLHLQRILRTRRIRPDRAV